MDVPNLPTLTPAGTVGTAHMIRPDADRATEDDRDATPCHLSRRGKRRASAVLPPSRALGQAHEDVVQHAEVLDQVELLVDHAHAGTMRAAGPHRGGDRDLTAPSLGTIARDRQRSSVVLPAPSVRRPATN